MYDVTVVGSGPVGSHTAFRLAKSGHKVLVLEKIPELAAPVCCTGIISQECAAAYQIDESIIIRRANSARFFSPSGQQIYLTNPDVVACILNRTALNQELARRAGKQGAEYHFGEKAVRVTREKTGTVVHTLKSRRSYSYCSRAVVLANGVGDHEGLSDRRSYPSHIVTGAQTEVESNLIEVEVYFGNKIAPGFFAWLVPTTPGRALVGLMAKRNAAYFLRILLLSLQTKGKITGSGTIHCRPMPVHLSSTTFSARTITVGSRAGQVKPTTGGGIGYGLMCADLAAGTLHEALEDNDFSTRKLSQYERAWKKKFSQEIRRGIWARRFFEGLKDGHLETMFKLVKVTALEQTVTQMSDLSFDWHSNILSKLIREKIGSVNLRKFREN